MSSQALSLSAWSHTPGVPKFVTCRVARPAPRTSTGTCSAGPYLGSSRFRHRAVGSATSMPSSVDNSTSAFLGTYAKSVTRVKTESLPASSNTVPSTRTVHDPDSGSTNASNSPVSITRRSPGSSRSTRNPA